MKVGFVSLGCSKNLVDSEYIIGLFEDGTFEFESNPAKCDIIVINTCGFILDAKKEAIDTILEMAEYKKQNLKKLIVCGCFVERYLDECKDEFKEVDLFVPIHDYPKLHILLKELLNHDFDASYKEKRKMITNNFYAYLKISDGCDNRCSYCAIPLIRGNCVSYPIEDLVKEAQRLYSLGVKELNVVAQDTTYYGKDLYGHFALKELLVELDKIPFTWIRVLYMYPDEIEDDLLEVMKGLKRVIPYFDIPIQYGNDRLLKLMNRRGSVKLIKEKVNKIRDYFKDAIIRTTIIVGFPYEDEDSFTDTIDLIKELRFDSLGAFTYSREEDTKSYDMPQLEEDIKNKRYDVLMNVQKEISLDINSKRVGKKYLALVERYESLFNRYIARSYMSAPDGIDGVIYVKTDKELEIGSFVEVEIIDYKEYDLIAKV